MKRTALSRILSTVLTVVMLFASLSTLFACSGGDGGGGGGGTTTPASTTTADPGEPMSLSSQYKLVTPTSSSRNEGIDTARNTIREAARSGLGLSFAPVIDVSSNPIDTEILLGDTNRAESAVAKAFLDTYETTGLLAFTVKVVNKKVVIYGTDHRAVALGGIWFANTYLIGNEVLTDKLSVVRFITEGEYLMNGTNAATHDAASFGPVAHANSLYLNGIPLSGFSPNTKEYALTLNRSDSIPLISVDVAAGMQTEIRQASASNMTAEVTVTSKDGSANTIYRIAFTQRSYDQLDAIVEHAKDGANGIVVFVHDDGDQDTATYLKNEFISKDLRGTIGLIASRVGSIDGALNQTAVTFWQNLIDTGRFNISSHSYSHSWWGTTDEDETGYCFDTSGNLKKYTVTAGKITRETAGAQELLRRAFPSQRVLTFIKPGTGNLAVWNEATQQYEKGLQISDKALEIIKTYYIAMRITGGDDDTVPTADPYNVNCRMVQASHNASKWPSYVNTAVKNNGMMVFLFHKIVPSDATSHSVLQSDATALFAHVSNLQAEGKVWCAFFEDAMLYTEEYRTATVDAKHLGDRIEVVVTDELDNTIYNYPLTVRVDLKDNTPLKMIAPDGTETPVTIKTGTESYYVHIPVVPDGGTVKLVPAN